MSDVEACRLGSGVLDSVGRDSAGLVLSILISQAGFAVGSWEARDDWTGAASTFFTRGEVVREVRLSAK